MLTNLEKIESNLKLCEDASRAFDYHCKRHNRLLLILNKIDNNPFGFLNFKTLKNINRRLNREMDMMKHYNSIQKGCLNQFKNGRWL